MASGCRDAELHILFDRHRSVRISFYTFFFFLDLFNAGNHFKYLIKPKVSKAGLLITSEINHQRDYWGNNLQSNIKSQLS
jgi:hypothetical protein